MAFGDFTVTRASTKNVLGDAGIYVSVANNVPAFEFNTDGTYRGLLVEPGATNLALQSQTFQTTWSVTRATISADQAVSPDGATTADKLIEDATASNTHFIAQNIAVTTGTAYTLSCYVKASERTNVCLRFFSANSAFATSRAFFNLATGVITSASEVNSATIEALPNGWYRISATETSTATATASVGITLVETGTTDSYTGDGTSGLFIWQAQLETGSVATSPIVTTAGTASRVADVVSLTGASSLIGQTSGTIFVEFDNTLISSYAQGLLIRLFETSNNELFIRKESGTNTYTARWRGNSINIYTQTSIAIADGISKIAFAYSSGSSAIYVNGVQIGTNATSGAFSASVGSIALGSSGVGDYFNDALRSVALFPTRLENATLASITA
jgi:hypothetical protein